MGYKSFREIMMLKEETSKDAIEYIEDDKFIITNPNLISWKNVVRILKQKGYDLRSADDAKERLMNWKFLRSNEDQGKAVLASLPKTREARTIGQKMETATKVYFGTTTDINEAGYIFQDGTMLDLSGKKREGFAGTRNFDHRQINYVPLLSKLDISGTEGMIKFIKETGSVRVNYANGELNFDFIKPLSSKQINTLKRYIDGRNALYASQKNELGDIIKHWEFELGKRFNVDQIAKESQ